MLRTLPRSHSRRRSGAVLIVVLAMLVLFAVLGLSFVLYSEAQLSAARGVKQSRNEETEPNPQLAAEGYLGGLIYDVGDTGDDLANPIRGHSLARSKYGYQAGVAGVLPFNATPTAAEPGGFNYNGITDSRQVVRFTWDAGTNSVFDPERFYNGAAPRNNPNAALAGIYAGKNYAFTYPDRHDYHLAWQDPTTGRVTLPSFHRPDLGNWTPGDPNNFANQPGGQFKTLRPISGAGFHPNFPPVPPNTDGTYTGDVQNIRYTAGVQHNDSYWMDAGGPVLRWRGKQYKAMVAPLVLDLSSRVNLSVAGNRRSASSSGAHSSGQGWGPWEVNPGAVYPNLLTANLDPMYATRYGGNAGPGADPYTQATSTRRINRGQLPPNTSRIDPDGWGSSAASSDGPMTTPSGVRKAETYWPFARYLYPRFANSHNLSGDAASGGALDARLASHPAQFNPLLSPRAAWAGGASAGFGLDALVQSATRYSDPKGRNRYPFLPVTTPAVDIPTASTSLTTFSTTQQFATVPIATGPGTSVRLAAIDINRPLRDYRRNPAHADGPLNNTPVAVNGGLTTQWLAALDRQRLALDIFLRLLAFTNLVDGTVVSYNPDTGYLRDLSAAPIFTGKSIQAVAQLAVNLVDQVDRDDVLTAFCWNPVQANLPLSGGTASTEYNPAADAANLAAAELPKRMLFGRELPRLVINEVYNCISNDPTDPFPVQAGKARASKPIKRSYWIELHNPTPQEPVEEEPVNFRAGSVARPERGAARLRYEANVTQVRDPAQARVYANASTTFNPYRIEVGDYEGDKVENPYSDFLKDNPANVAVDATNVPLMTLRAQIDKFVQDPTAPAPTLAATPDELNVIHPLAPGAPSVGPNGGNTGYYVIGPKDPLPGGGVASTLSLANAPAGVPTAANLVSALSFDASAAAPSELQVVFEHAVWGVIILRRLADPYRPPDNTPGPNFNPYVTVDFQNKLSPIDRVSHTTDGPNQYMVNGGTLGGDFDYSRGRRHAYKDTQFADFQAFGPKNLVPGHTFFANNNPMFYPRPFKDLPSSVEGITWVMHLDREAVNVLELLHASVECPGFFGPDDLDVVKAVQGRLFTQFRNLRNSEQPTALLDLLTTPMRMPGCPVGGREPGKINLNTVASESVLRALFDPTQGNAFHHHWQPGGPDGTFDVKTVWDNMAPAAAGPVTARTVGGMPRATVHEGGTDLPFRHVATFVRGAADDSEFRSLPGDPIISTTPIFLDNFQEVKDRGSYLQMEPLRKIWNSTSHTSDSFLVVMTVGFFEVTATNPVLPISVTNPPLFGGELFDKVPGDLRARFSGVVDRSCLASSGPGGGGVPAAAPFQTKLTSHVQASTAGATAVLPVEARFVPAGAVLPDGTTATADTAVLFNDGANRLLKVVNGQDTQLRIGYADVGGGSGDGEVVTVRNVRRRYTHDAAGNLTVPVPGEVELLTVGAKPTRFHAGGTLVSSVVFGNPGPQPGVTLPQLQARGLVPYFTRLEP